MNCFFFNVLTLLKCVTMYTMLTITKQFLTEKNIFLFKNQLGCLNIHHYPCFASNLSFKNIHDYILLICTNGSAMMLAFPTSCLIWWSISRNFSRWFTLSLYHAFEYMLTGTEWLVWCQTKILNNSNYLPLAICFVWSIC